MNAALDLEAGFDFPVQEFVVERAGQARKLNCCGIDPDLYGDAVDVVMLGLPTLNVLIDSGVIIMGGVHLTQRFKQLEPVRFDEPVSVSGRILELGPHPRGAVLKCRFAYTRADGTVLVEAVRSGIIPMGEPGPSAKLSRPDEDLDGFDEIMRHPLDPPKVAEYSDSARNLIHSDPEVARQHGFRAPIAAGLMGLHYYREALEKRYAPSTFDLEVWFRRPMFWDDTLSLVAQEVEGRIAAMHLLNSDGKPTSNAVVPAVG